MNDKLFKTNDISLLEEVRIGLYILQKGKFSFVNSHLLSMLGFKSKNQLLGKSFWSIVHPDDIANVSFKSEDNGASGKKRKNRFRVLRKDGSAVWVRIKGKNIRYHGKPANLGHLEEIAAIKELEKSVEKYKMIIHEVEDAVAETDLDGNLLFFNASGARRYGSIIEKFQCDRIESYLKKNRVNYRSYLDEKTIETVREAYRNIYKTGIPNKNITYEIIKRDGQRMMVEDSVSLIRDHDDKVIGYRAVSRDISNRVAAEKKMTEQRIRLEAIFRSVSDAIITVDNDFKVIEANASTKSICGVDAEKIIGRKFPGCIQGCSNCCSETMSQALSQKEITKESMIECRHKEHGHQMVAVSGSPLLDSNGRSMGGVLVIRDITRLKNLENELLLRHQFQNIIGKNKKMQQIYSLLENLSNLDTTVLITGKSGTGKELVARALHYGGRRARKPFITVNCSALVENLLESELFGHVKGAFTGAISDKQGRFHAANGGTIMLDEIGDISPLIQLKLLRVIQEKEFERVGEVKPYKIDVRILACTNADLYQKVKRGEFRSDLYYRLKVMEINLPPLNERSEDIPLLVEHFCKFFRKQFGKQITGISNDAMETLMNYDWPGNVRELKHVIERAFVLCSGKVISLQQLPAEIIRKKASAKKRKSNSPKRYNKNKEAILFVLKRTGGNKSKAAKILGISRQTLYRRIEEYKIGAENLKIKAISRT